MSAEAKAMPGAKPHSRPKAKKGTFPRLIKTLFKFYPVLLPVTMACILFSSAVSAIPSLFIQKIIQIIEQNYALGDWETAFSLILPQVMILATFYLLSLLSMLLYTQLMAYITQGFLLSRRTMLICRPIRISTRTIRRHHEPPTTSTRCVSLSRNRFRNSSSRE